MKIIFKIMYTRRNFQQNWHDHILRWSRMEQDTDFTWFKHVQTDGKSVGD